MNAINFKTLCALIGMSGGIIASWFGGWNAAINTLLIFIAIDYASGLMLAIFFHKSPKTKTGRAESKICFKGLCRKGMIILLLLIGARLDMILGTSYIRDGICIAFIINELLSIVENAGLMGVPLPPVLINAIDALKQKSMDSTANKNNKEGKK